jgi:hypothetical protein
MQLYSRVGIVLFFLFSFILILFSIPGSEKLSEYYFENHQYDKSLKYIENSLQSSRKLSATNKQLQKHHILNGDYLAAIDVFKEMMKQEPKELSYINKSIKLAQWVDLPEYAMKLELKLLELSVDKSLSKEILLGQLQEYQFKQDSVNELKTIERLDAIGYPVFDLKTEYFIKSGETDRLLKHLIKNIEQTKDRTEYFSVLITLVKQIGNYSTFTEFSYDYIVGKIKEGIKKENVEIEELYLVESEQGMLKRFTDFLIENDFPYPIIRDYVYRSVVQSIGEQDWDLPKSWMDILSRSRKRKIMYFLATFYRKNRNFNESVIWYQRLRKKYPKNLIYIRELAELYQKTGDKKKALRLYYMILKMQGKAFFNFTNGVLLASSGGIKDLPKFGFKSKTKLPDQYINDIRFRIYSLHIEKKEYREALDIIDDIIRNQPNDQLKEWAVYLCFEIKDEDRALSYMEKMNQENLGQDLLEYRISVNYEKGQYKLALRDIKKLATKADWVMGIEEDIVFQIGSKKEYQKICSQIEKNGQNLETRYRCSLRLNKPKRSISLLRKLIKVDPNNKNYRNDIINIALDIGYLNTAKKHLLYLKKNNLFERLNKRQLRRYLDLKRDQDFEESFDVEVLSNWYLLGDYHYNDSSFSVIKNLGSKWGIGAKVRSYFGLEESENRTQIAGMNLRYYKKDFYTLLNISKAVGYHDLGYPYMVAMGGSLGITDVNISFFDKNFLVDLPVLAEDKYGHKSYLTVDANWKNEKHSLFTSVSRQWIKFLNKDARYDNFVANYLKSIGNYQYKVGLSLNYSIFDSLYQEISQYYIRKSGLYYLVGKYEKIGKLKEIKSLGYALEINVGGDIERDVSFGTAYIFRGLLYLERDLDKELRLFINYYKETGNSLEDSFVNYGLDFRYWI